MKTQTPNPLLKNTAIFVGNDAELRKKAIEYYEREGYKQESVLNRHPDCVYISIGDDGVDLFIGAFGETAIKYDNCKIITIPEKQPITSGYPKWMFTSNSGTVWGSKPRFIIGELNGKFISEEKFPNLLSWDLAKDIETVELTIEELKNAYELANNVTVKVKL
jgi:hypothetical protein